MKPIIYFQYNCWFCGITKYDAYFGMDMTPAKAYASWKAGGWLAIDAHLSKGQA